MASSPTISDNNNWLKIPIIAILLCAFFALFTLEIVTVHYKVNPGHLIEFVLWAALVCYLYFNFSRFSIWALVLSTIWVGIAAGVLVLFKSPFSIVFLPSYVFLFWSDYWSVPSSQEYLVTLFLIQNVFLGSFPFFVLVLSFLFQKGILWKIAGIGLFVGGYAFYYFALAQALRQL